MRRAGPSRAGGAPSRVPALRCAASVAVAGLLVATPAAQVDVPLPERDGLTGLEWRFVRIQYRTPAEQLAEFLREVPPSATSIIMITGTRHLDYVEMSLTMGSED